RACRGPDEADGGWEAAAAARGAAAIAKGNTQTMESLAEPRAAEPSVARTFAARACRTRCWLLIHCHQINPAPSHPRAADHRLAAHRNRVLEGIPDQLSRAGRSGAGGSVGGCGVVLGATLCGAASAGAAAACGATPTSLR